MSYQKDFNYHKLSYDLSTARTDKLIPLQGNIICVLNSSSKDCKINVKFWREYSEYLELSYGGNLVVPFQEFYISNDIQTGKHIDLLIVKGISWEEFKASGSLGFDAIPDIENVNVQNFPDSQNVYNKNLHADFYCYPMLNNFIIFRNMIKNTLLTYGPMYRGWFIVEKSEHSTPAVTNWYFHLYMAGPGKPNFSMPIMNPGNGTFLFPSSSPATLTDDGIAIRLTCPFNGIGVGYTGGPPSIRVNTYFMGENYLDSA